MTGSVPEAQGAMAMSGYICSSARSGSTITDMILGGHSRIASLGELNFLGKAIRIGTCSCELPLVHCPEWNRVFDAILERHGVDPRTDPYRYELWDARAVRQIDHAFQTPAFLRAMKLRAALVDARQGLPFAAIPLPGRLARAVDNKLALYAAIRDRWDVDCTVDSSKNLREAVELCRRSEGVRVIFLHRDGRGSTHSMLKAGATETEALAAWTGYYARARRLLGKLPGDRLLRLRYEDLAAAPEEWVPKLCAFLGVEHEPAMLEMRGPYHLVNGNPTRMRAGQAIRVDESWRDGLSSAFLARFEREAGSLNRWLGHDD